MAADGAMPGLAFIDAAGNYLGFQQTHLLLDGAWQLTGTSWAFTTSNPTSILANTSGGVPLMMGLVGSGTVNPRVRFEGNFGMSNPPSNAITHDYDVANALAVTQADAAGTWSASGLSAVIGASGAVTARFTSGTIGDCSFSGTVLLASAGSKKNLYTVAVTPSNGPSGACSLTTGQTYSGYAAITFTNVGSAGSPSYVRTLTLLVRNGGSWFAAGLPKS